MPYIVTRQSSFDTHHQMTLEELIYQTYSAPSRVYKDTNTYTHYYSYVDTAHCKGISLSKLGDKLVEFNSKYEDLINTDKHTLYHEFYIPKASGGFRKISAPCPELMKALNELKDIFEDDFKALYHTSAFAYIKNRSTVDCVKRHQANDSKWFAKFDISGFFNNTTIDFVMNMFSYIYPFSEFIKYLADGESIMRRTLSLCFLDGGLPQGTPISPLITNVMMIPVDFSLARSFRKLKSTRKNGMEEEQRYIYTRYADDFIISARHDFDFRDIENVITTTLKNADAPFEINKKKTHYGSSSGQNWILGVMLNGENNITIGHKNKKNFQNALHNYARDKRAGKPWSLEDCQHLQGIYSYYKMIEGSSIVGVVNFCSDKEGMDILKELRDDIRFGPGRINQKNNKEEIKQ